MSADEVECGWGTHASPVSPGPFSIWLHVLSTHSPRLCSRVALRLPEPVSSVPRSLGLCVSLARGQVQDVIVPVSSALMGTTLRVMHAAPKVTRCDLT